MPDLDQARRQSSNEPSRPAQRRDHDSARAAVDHAVFPRRVQAQLTVNAPDDPFEREAERAADAATRPGATFGSLRQSALANSLTPLVQRAADKNAPKPKDEDDRKHVQKAPQTGVAPVHAVDDEHKKHDEPAHAQKSGAGAGAAVATAGVETTVRRMMSGGDPLPTATRAALEPRFGHDFSHVRVHTGPDAAGSALALGARAFTVGDHVFFAAGEYRPSTAEGAHLIAHELAHTIQQQPAGRISRELRVQRLDGPLASIAERLRGYAAQLPPYELLTVLLGRDPITDQPVERSAANIVHAALRLVPDGDAVYEQLTASGTLQREAAWLDAQVAQLHLTWEGIQDLLHRAIDAIGPSAIFHLAAAWETVRSIFQPTLDRISTFAHAVGSHIVDLIKQLVLGRLRDWAQGVPGYHLLTFVLGRDPFTDEAVARTAEAFIHAVLELVPGGEETFQNLQRARTIERTMTWLQAEIARLDLTWDGIKAMFLQAWNAFTVADLLHPVALFERIGAIFGPPLQRVLRFAAAVGRKVLEFIFEGAMTLAGPLGAQIVRIFQRASAVFDQIVADPVRFVHNLIDAIGLGFRQFMHNIGEHLRTGVIGWLTGALEGAGIVLPTEWNLQGILSLVLQVLGITWQRIRLKIVRVIGEERMQMLERVFDFIQILVTRGPMALWDRIVESLGNLWDTVIGGIRAWAISRIVQAAVTRLLTLFNPAGAVIQAVIATYDTIKFFIQKIQQIADTVEAIVESIGRIAAGILGPAANAVEHAMARTIPVVLDFLAELIGLGDVSGQIRRIIEALQERVDHALDRAVAWIVERGRALLGRTTQPEPAAGAAAPGDERWNTAATGVNAELDRMLASGTDPEAIRHELPNWKTRFGFTNLELELNGDELELSGEMSPKRRVRALPVGIHYDHQLQGDKAKQMHAVPIRRTDYSAPYDELVGWDRLNHNYWIRGHLLHGRSSGPGAFWNMTPIPKSVNLAMYSRHEQQLHDVVLAPSPPPLTWFRANVDYYTAGDSRVNPTIARPSDFPKRITIQYGPAELKADGSYRERSASVTEPYDIDPPTTASRDLVAGKVTTP